MPSNDSPAFDVLTDRTEAECIEAVEYVAAANYAWREVEAKRQVEAAFKALREAIRARQTERGEVSGQLTDRLIAATWNAWNADEGLPPLDQLTPREQDAVRGFAQAMFAVGATRESHAPEAARDTDFARARVEGAREVLTKYADSLGPAINALDVAERMSVLAFRDREYPAPKPAECRLSDGSVAWKDEDTGVWMRGKSRTAGWQHLSGSGHWCDLLNRPTDCGPDLDALKAFAATRTEGQ